MNYQGMMNNQGCSTCPHAVPTSNTCYNVVNTCNVEEVPHVTNYHTHVVNNCVKRHINIPTYSTSQENVIVNEYVEGAPVYQQPVYQQAMYQQNMYQQPYNQGMYNQQPIQGMNPTGVADSSNMSGPNYQGIFNPVNNQPFNF